MERSPSVGDAVAGFLDDLAARGVPPATVRTYRAQLRRLDPAENVRDLSTARCRALLAERVRDSGSLNTARTFHAALAALCAWLVDARLLPVSPMDGLKAPRKPRTQPKVPLPAQMRRLWAACDDEELRIALVLWGHGLRASEAHRLRYGDVREDGVIRFRGKRDVVRPVVLPPDLLRLISDRQARLGADDRAPIFTASLYTLGDRLRRLGKRVGIPWVHPHALRHAWATEWMRRTQDMDTLRILGGWSPSSAMPQHYAHLALEEAAIEKARRVDLGWWGE